MTNILSTGKRDRSHAPPITCQPETVRRNSKQEITDFKKEHHEGKATRLIPMFPKLQKELKAQWELAEEGSSPYVIDRWRNPAKENAQNMRTHFRRIIFRAGLPEWERTFQNLRESRANEIWSEYPEHVARAWMGHSKRVAIMHYLQVTDEQFQKALQKEPDEETPEPVNLGTHLGTLTM